jgi:hypothetical protein
MHRRPSTANKSRILEMRIHITGIGCEPEFNRAGDEWVDRTNLPHRAHVGALLKHDEAAEVAVTAAIGSSGAGFGLSELY